jgi:hypothetical protein
MLDLEKQLPEMTVAGPIRSTYLFRKIARTMDPPCVDLLKCGFVEP